MSEKKIPWAMITAIGGGALAGLCLAHFTSSSPSQVSSFSPHLFSKKAYSGRVFPTVNAFLEKKHGKKNTKNRYGASPFNMKKIIGNLRPSYDDQLQYFFKLSKERDERESISTFPEEWKISYGKKFDKITRGTSVWAFIAKEDGEFKKIPMKQGDIFKAASFRAPAKHARGNIFNRKNPLEGVGIYGPQYLKSGRYSSPIFEPIMKYTETDRNITYKLKKNMDADDITHYAQILHHTPEDFEDGDIVQRIHKFPRYVLKEINVDDVDFEEWEWDEEHVDGIVELMKKSQGYMPIILDADLGVIDGTHRGQAFIKSGMKTALMYVPEKEKSKSAKDKLWQIGFMTPPSWSDEPIYSVEGVIAKNEEVAKYKLMKRHPDANIQRIDEIPWSAGSTLTIFGADDDTLKIPNKRVRFKGNFRDLKNHGYKFWKAYARDYKVYSKKGGGKTINIWVGGREVEYTDLFGLSYLLFEKLKDFKIPKANVQMQGLKGVWIPRDYAKFAINKKLERLEDYDMYKHNDAHLFDLSNSDEEIDRILDEYHDTYQVVIISQKSLALVQELWDNDLIEIIPEDRWKRGKDGLYHFGANPTLFEFDGKVSTPRPRRSPFNMEKIKATMVRNTKEAKEQRMLNKLRSGYTGEDYVKFLKKTYGKGYDKNFIEHEKKRFEDNDISMGVLFDFRIYDFLREWFGDDFKYLKASAVKYILAENKYFIVFNGYAYRGIQKVNPDRLGYYVGGQVSSGGLKGTKSERAEMTEFNNSAKGLRTRLVTLMGPTMMKFIRQSKKGKYPKLKHPGVKYGSSPFDMEKITRNLTSCKKKKSDEMAGWIAFYDRKKVEIGKHEASSLWGAKQLAIKKLRSMGVRIPKSKEHMVAIDVGYEEYGVSPEHQWMPESLKRQMIPGYKQEKGRELVRKREEIIRKHLREKDFPRAGITFVVDGDLGYNRRLLFRSFAQAVQWMASDVGEGSRIKRPSGSLRSLHNELNRLAQFSY